MSPARRRQAIIDSTLAVAKARGLGATTVREVAAHMNTSSGLIHHYFESMDHLLAAAFEQAAAADLGRSRALTLAEDDPPSRLRAFIESYAATQSDETMQLWLDAWAEAARRPTLGAASKRLNREWHDLVSAVIEEGVADGSFTNDDPNGAAWRLLSVLDGLSLQIVAHDALIQRDELVRWALAAAAHEVGTLALT